MWRKFTHSISSRTRHFKSISEGTKSCLCYSANSLKLYSTGSVTKAIILLSSMGASKRLSMDGCLNFARLRPSFFNTSKIACCYFRSFVFTSFLSSMKMLTNA